MRATTAAGLVLAVIAWAAPRAAGAQDPQNAAAGARALAERVARAGGGTVRFQYAARPGVCGDGTGGLTWVRGDDTSHFGRWYSDGDGDGARWRCEAGPARVTLTLRDGVPATLKLTVGGRPAAAATDLGPVDAPAAAAYLLGVAARADGFAGEQAVLAAAVADASPLWPGLLRLARDDRAPTAARRAGTFWASQFACDAVREVRARRGPVARADTSDREVRKQVVFALSQRRGDERTAPLTRVARADRDPAVRCSALFWLGQGARGRGVADAETLALFEEVLRRP